MKGPGAAPRISVVMPLTRGNPEFLLQVGAVRSALEDWGRSYEFLIVVDGRENALLPDLRRLRRESQGLVSLVILSKQFGESTALMAGFQHARGEVILALAEDIQVVASSLTRALELLEQEGVDVAVGRRYPRRDSAFNRAQSAAFHWVVQRLTGTRFQDLSCNVWAMKRRVAEELKLYGDLHRFIPILALNLGFEVREVEMEHQPQQRRWQMFGLGAYVRRMVDALTVFFLVRFTRKPLRLFGALGLVSLGAGGALTLYLGIYRLLGFGAIANRPLLLLGLLLIVVGIQSTSIGLLGEMIIFTHARKATQYRVEEIVESPAAGGARPSPAAAGDAARAAE